MKHGTAVCSIMVAVALCAAPLAAQKAQGAQGARAKEKIEFVQKSLLEGEKNAQIWWGLWIAGYAALSAGQYALAGVAWNHNEDFSRLDRIKDDFNMASKTTFPKKEQWVNYTVGATKSALSLGLLLVMPFTPAYAAGRLAEMPAGSDEEIARKLNEAERILEKCAKKETMGRAWWKHLMGIGVNAAGSIIIWQCQKGKDPWKDAIISFFTGFAVFEATVWTQPTRAIKDWQEYRRRYYGETGAAYGDGYEDRWYLTTCPGGLAVGMAF